MPPTPFLVLAGIKEIGADPRLIRIIMFFFSRPSTECHSRTRPLTLKELVSFTAMNTLGAATVLVLKRCRKEMDVVLAVDIERAILLPHPVGVVAPFSNNNFLWCHVDEASRAEWDFDRVHGQRLLTFLLSGVIMVVNLWLSDISGTNVLDLLYFYLVRLAARPFTILRSSCFRKCLAEIVPRFTTLTVSAFHGFDQPRSDVTAHFFDFVSTWRYHVSVQWVLHKKHGLAAVGNWIALGVGFSASRRPRATNLLFNEAPVWLASSAEWRFRFHTQCDVTLVVLRELLPGLSMEVQKCLSQRPWNWLTNAGGLQTPQLRAVFTRPHHKRAESQAVVRPELISVAQTWLFGSSCDFLPHVHMLQ